MKPTLLLIAAGLLLLSSVGPAGAHGGYTVTKTAILGGTVDVSGVGTIRTGTACQSTLGAGTPLFCDHSGLGGATIDLSRGADPSIEAPIERESGTGNVHHHHPYASGSCGVAAAVPSVGTRFFFTCGVDRNADGFVTDAPVCDVESDGVSGSGSWVSDHDECTGQVSASPNERHADDWVEGCYTTDATSNGPYCERNLADGDNGAIQNHGSRPFCFQDNVRGLTAGYHGDGWDKLIVLIGTPVPDTSVLVGVTTVTVTVGGDDDGCGIVSGHTTSGNDETDRISGALCGEEFSGGTRITWACPEELCGLPQGTVAIVANGVPGSVAPVGTLTCHDSSHQATGSISTLPGFYGPDGRWITVAAGPIVSGTHAHCNLPSLGVGTTYARVQCAKQ